mmetsp:Transcript_26909/g.30005  ORF Transcript_26909/g.30005 Transcript_26909/m.30005 type:complete len:400 (+) Transcript_26909:44-1243(+)
MRALNILLVAALLSIAYTQIPNMCSTDASCPICNCAADMACAGDIDPCSSCTTLLMSGGCDTLSSSTNVFRVSSCAIIEAGAEVRTLRVQNNGDPVCVMIEEGATVRTLNFAASTADNCVFVNGEITRNANFGSGNDCVFVSGRTSGAVNLGEGTNTATYYGGRATGTISGGDELDCIKALTDTTAAMEGSSLANVMFGQGSGCLFAEGSAVNNVDGEGNDPNFIGLVDSTISSVTFTGMSDDGFSMIEGNVRSSSEIRMGAGSDKVFIENAQVSGNIYLEGGDDDLSIGCSQIWNIMGGTENDCIDVFDSTADEFNGGTLDGEAGDDEMIVSDSSLREILGDAGDDELFDCNNVGANGVGQPTVDGGADTDACSSDSAGTNLNCEGEGAMCPPPVVAP